MIGDSRWGIGTKDNNNNHPFKEAKEASKGPISRYPI